MGIDTKLNVAIVQAAPIPLAIGDGIRALVAHVRPLVENGSEMIAFGETFLGGYPLWLDEAPGAALWDAPDAKALHAILLREALVEDDPRLQPLQDMIDASGVLVSFGAHRRIRNSLYNAQYLMRSHAPPLVHLKLVPTHGERLIWARGDGSTLGVHAAEWGNAGSLICWEHWMPLARAAMHHAGETVHVAAWPTLREMYLVASRHYAFEGRCFVLAAATIQSRADLLVGLERVGGDPAARDLLMAMPDRPLQAGGSAIIAPDGTVVAQAGEGAEILTATLDLSAIDRGLASLDSDGHYSRPDVFELTVDRREKTGVRNREAG